MNAELKRYDLLKRYDIFAQQYDQNRQLSEREVSLITHMTFSDAVTGLAVSYYPNLTPSQEGGTHENLCV